MEHFQPTPDIYYHCKYPRLMAECIAYCRTKYKNRMKIIQYAQAMYLEKERQIDEQNSGNNDGNGPS